MDWITGVERAVDYLEENLTHEIDYKEAARRAYASVFHFTRIFGWVCACTPSEYVRRRRMTLAAADLAAGHTVTDVAFTYGYDTPESFSRAFCKFHGVKPSQVKRGATGKLYPRFTAKSEEFAARKDGEAADGRQCFLQELPPLVLTGYTKRFAGVPFGRERAAQEERFITTTRAKQWLLLGASCDTTTDYCVVSNIAEDGYDFTVAYELDAPTREDLRRPDVTGVDFLDKLGLHTVAIPAQTYLVWRTPHRKRPVPDYIDLRAAVGDLTGEEICRRIAAQCPEAADYVWTDAPEVVAMRWRCGAKSEWAQNRYIEVRLPVEKRK